MRRLIVSILTMLPFVAHTNYIKYYCPAVPEDFKRVESNKNLEIAHTNYNGVEHTWYAKDPKPTQFPEQPDNFKGANLTNCENGQCDIECYYFANVEDHVMVATAKSQPDFTIPEEPNKYLKDFQCQFTEHTDCPFIIDAN